MKLAGLLLAALFGQRLLVDPALPSVLSHLWLPVLVLVWIASTRHDEPHAGLGILVGLGWDVLLSPVVLGPGGIAWSFGCVILRRSAALLADRGPGTWAILGGLTAASIGLGTWMAQLPLGIAFDLKALVEIVLINAAAASLLGAILGADLPGRWLAWRQSKLR